MLHCNLHGWFCVGLAIASIFWIPEIPVAVKITLAVVGVIFLLFSNPRVRFAIRTGRFGQYLSSKEQIKAAVQGPNAPAVTEGWWGQGTLPPKPIALRGNW